MLFFIRTLFISFLLMTSFSANADWFGSNDCPPWAYDCNDWPEWTPMYWMEEFSNEMDNDNYGYGGGYGAPYGYGAPMPYGMPPASYGAPMPYYGGAPMPYYGGGPVPYGAPMGGQMPHGMPPRFGGYQQGFTNGAPVPQAPPVN